jgi:RNA polymerase sigma-70 factor, ECF subfamily
MKVEDQDIIAKVLGGDYNAFETLVDKYQARVYRHLRKMVGDPSLVEDLLQESFLSAYRGLRGFAGNSSFSTWLFRIATNAALMFLRKHQPEMLEYDDTISGEPSVVTAPGSPEFLSTPLDMLLSKEGRSILENAIDELPVSYRSVLVLRDVDGFSLQETAEILDASVPAVKSRLHRARNLLRATLISYYGDRNNSHRKEPEGR